MKIALIRQRYTPFGGAERFVERALSALRAAGSEVTLMTRSWAGAPESGLNIQICNPPYARFWGGRAARDVSFARAVQGLMAQGYFDIIQAHERIPGCSVFRAGDGVHAAWLDRRARVLGPLARWAQRLSPFHRQVLAAEKAVLSHPSLQAVICNSELVAGELERYYGLPREKIALIYNGVDTDVFHPGLSDQYRALVRAEYGIPTDAPVFLFVGSGFARKGVPTLLRAFAALSLRTALRQAQGEREGKFQGERGGKAQSERDGKLQDEREGKVQDERDVKEEPWLVIVGADRKRRAMERLAARLGIADRVLFTGPLPDVRPWYGAADAFVLPTLYDPCPNAALEALACGLPCLVSDACGAAELLTSGENGAISDPLDVSALATHMADLSFALADSGKRLAMRHAARQAVEGLTLPRMADALLSLYQRLLAERSGAPAIIRPLQENQEPA